jgi:HEAT repeat protein
VSHLSGDYNEDELRSMTAKLGSGEIMDAREIQHTIGVVADVTFLDAKPIIEAYLGDDDSFVRAEAIRALASWFKCQERRPTCERIIEYETDFDARIAAISRLAS